MKKLLTSVLLTSALTLPSTGWAQENTPSHLLKTDINAEAEHAEVCLEFDRPLLGTPARLASSLKLQMDDKTLPLPTLAVTGSSLCLFPLEHGKDYHLDVSNLRLGDDEKFSHRLSFSVPQRTPSMAFTGKDGAINGFDFYRNILSLRTVNVAAAHLSIYHVSDKATMAHAWLERGQDSLAPSESLYLAKTKGEKIWQNDLSFDTSLDKADVTQINLKEILPTLASGLYLVVATAGNNDDITKNVSPLAALWLTKSDFSLQAIEDKDGIHSFATQNDTNPKTDIHLTAFNKKGEQIAESDGSSSGVNLMVPAQGADKSVVLLATDRSGNVAFADVNDLPMLSKEPAPGSIHLNSSFALPGSPVSADLSFLTPQTLAAGDSVLRVGQENNLYADLPVGAVNASGATLTFAAPASQALWALRWQKADGGTLAEMPLRVTTNGDASHLDISSMHDLLGGDLVWTGDVKSVTSTRKPAPLVGGHVEMTWQSLDPAIFGWKDYSFGLPETPVDTPVVIAAFVSDLEGRAPLRVTLPKPPQDHGLYQAVLRARADADAGVTETAPLVLPLRADTPVIGIKALASDAHFPQNAIARFALIAVAGDGKARDVDDLSYQLYEEGRHFDWFQENGRWQYKPEAQLRPIGGGDVSIKADGSSAIDWPVTAGNYRLEILDENGKKLAQTTFSAGWDAVNNDNAMPLAISISKNLQAGHEAEAHFHLTDDAMVTAIIADRHILKAVHEFRHKGENVISFTPGVDWLDKISVSITAQVPKNDELLRGEVEASLAQGMMKPPQAIEGVTAISTEDLAALVLRKDSFAALGFALSNTGNTSESYHAVFSTSPGLKIESQAKSDVKLDAGQSQSLPLAVSASTPGVKEVRLEITSGKSHISRSWNVSVAPRDVSLQSAEERKIDPGQPLSSPAEKEKTNETTFLIARHPMDGLLELLTYLLNARPFTTQELSSSIEALRLWEDTIAETGLMPDPTGATARRQQQIMQLLLHQNPDGGFAAWRGGVSTMSDTSAAVAALGINTSDMAVPSEKLAVAWLKQRLSNTWLDEKERPTRAAAYAALAVADALDISSLHYFSDTSAQDTLPPLAEANIAAAFKHARDPNAAAFWIRKMLDENGEAKPIALLDALAATDALSSDDVHSAMKILTERLRKNNAPDIVDVAQLLHALAVDNSDAGKARIASNHDIRDINGILVMHNEVQSYHDDDALPLYVTAASENPRLVPASPTGTSISRHVLRLNGVELPLAAKPRHGEIYLVELKGNAATQTGQTLVQDGGNGLRPMGCPLSLRMENLSFIPWFTSQDMTPVTACEYSPHRLNIVLAHDGGATNFSSYYFATIDAATIADLPAPRLRFIK